MSEKISLDSSVWIYIYFLNSQNRKMAMELQ